MAKNYSTTLHETVNSVSAAEAPLLLLEIDHPDLSQPIRVVNDNQDLVHQGNTFVAMAFRARLPDDLEQGLPRAILSVDNVGKEMVSWLEASNGGQGATCRMIQVLRSAPDVVEWETTLNLTDLRITQTEVTGSLGYEDLLNMPGVRLRYRPEVAPGLF